MLDTHAKPDQMRRLVDNHVGVEQRCRDAYQVAASVGAVVRVGSGPARAVVAGGSYLSGPPAEIVFGVAFCGLQWWWGYLILRQVKKMIFGKKGAKAE